MVASRSIQVVVLGSVDQLALWVSLVFVPVPACICTYSNYKYRLNDNRLNWSTRERFSMNISSSEPTSLVHMGRLKIELQFNEGKKNSLKNSNQFTLSASILEKRISRFPSCNFASHYEELFQNFVRRDWLINIFTKIAYFVLSIPQLSDTILAHLVHLWHSCRSPNRVIRIYGNCNS